MVKSFSSALIWRGAVALAIGITALAWPEITVLALVYIFAISALLAAGFEVANAVGSTRGKPVVTHLLLGLVDLAAGAIAIAWPGATALVLVLLVASWAMAAGALEVYAGLRSGEVAGTRAMLT